MEGSGIEGHKDIEERFHNTIVLVSRSRQLDVVNTEEEDLTPEVEVEAKVSR